MKPSYRLTLRSALRPDSILYPCLREGIQAVRASDRSALDEALRPLIADSLDFDTALAKAHPNAPRWDYFVSFPSKGCLFGLEVHPASGRKEVEAVIAKKTYSAPLMKAALHSGGISWWFWVPTRQVGLSPMDRTRRILQQNGITLVAREVSPHDLP